MALAPKKSVAIRVRRETLVTASSVDPTPPVVAPMPSVSQTGGEAEGAPLEVVEQLTVEAIPLPTSELAKLPTTLIASTTAGAA